MEKQKKEIGTLVLTLRSSRRRAPARPRTAGLTAASGSFYVQAGSVWPYRWHWRNISVRTIPPE